MKKLKLSLSNLESTELLSREQLKKITGGDGSDGTCTAHTNCSTGYVECSSTLGVCNKGSNWVQCDGDPKNYCY